MSKAEAQALKKEGNTFFASKDYENAIIKYTAAIELDPSDVTFYSNRSACYAALNKWAEAAEDGRSCIMVDKAFVKGYFRQALALKNLEQYENAIEAAKRGLAVDAQNADLKKMTRELEEVMRLKKVEAAIVQAETLAKEGDLAGSLKAADAGLRLDPGNRDLTKLIDRVRPQFERQEKVRMSSLSPSERQKEEGDNLFKAARFEEAIKAYTRALDSITDKSSELALKCYGNRAACYKQISDFDNVIFDSTMVLEVKPDDPKALMRRAQAYEAVERYKSSLQDVRQVLALGIEVVGKTTFDLANGMQHRLNRVIAQLRG